ncbi:MAG TPA: AMP-binding protein, partial [Thermoanaerobaculia bacterium]|nr:AMP-binding protein [Thermoanaerobaculia bacterium]
VVGSPVANRRRGETEGLIGLFINTLALRTRLDGDPSFTELLARVRETALAAFAHQDLPFERLVEELAPQRSLAHTPLFQVLFALNNAPLEPLSLPGLRLEPLPLDPGVAKFDLTLGLAPAGEGLAGYLEHSTELFDASTIERLWGHFERVLASAVAAPDQPVSQLSWLSAGERQQVVWEWRGPSVVGGVEGEDVWGRFVAQAELAGERVALVCGEERWSYGGLAGWSARWGAALSARGVGPECRVGVGLPREPPLVAALLAVGWAGGAYVPLDLSYPRERLRWLLEDSGAGWVVGEASSLPAEALGRCEVIAPEELERAIPAGGSASWALSPGRAWGIPARGLAYLIYTSGSTGRPKAVAIEAGGALARLSWARERYSEGELSGVLASTSVCFDLSVFELFGPLCSGGTVVLVSDALALGELPA